jgi:hypothetical protein
MRLLPLIDIRAVAKFGEYGFRIIAVRHRIVLSTRAPGAVMYIPKGVKLSAVNARLCYQRGFPQDCIEVNSPHLTITEERQSALGNLSNL